MTTSIHTIEYRCSDDCKQSGCPGHIGSLSYQSVADSYLFNMNGRELGFKRGELEAMIQLIINLDRCDAVKINR